MSTLLHLLLWTLVTVATPTVVAALTVRWAWRRTRRAVLSRLQQLGVRATRPLRLSAPLAGSRLLPAAGTSLTRSLSAPMRVRARAAVPGPGREVAVVRRALRADVAGADRSVSTGRQAGRPVEGLGSIVRRLREQAHVLDVDLAVIASEPDRRVRQQLLRTQDGRVLLLRRACAEVRRGVLLAGSATTAPLLSSMVDDLNDEVIALGLRARAYAELTGH
ncbi:MAG: hypothetical protein JWO12_1146 [Frankiales bacterium]|nr:hypothetical protein [Frankiales bacterium]